jgi:hypothetical protein
MQDKFMKIIDSYPGIKDKALLERMAATLGKISIADPGKPTEAEWKKLLTWAKNTQRAGQYHTQGIEAILELLDAKTESYGTEAIFGHKQSSPFRGYWMDICGQYINRGDTYDTTILYDSVKERFCLTSWGDWVERYETKYGVS